ncbi:MAG: fatty acid desaturase [Bacteroidetes bacterium]|nr:fatty acid desaturase [Bacteroidota bacterium]
MGRWRNTGYLLGLLPVLVTIAGTLAGGIYTASNLLLTLVLLPLLEWVAGRNRRNGHSPAKDIYPAAILYICVALHTCAHIVLWYAVYTGRLQGAYLLLAVLSTGAEAAAGVVAHELVHKPGKLNRTLGLYLLLSRGNFYFFIHHLRIHHRDVATAADAASARMGESFYTFLVRTIPGQISQAWQSEKIRIQRQNRSAWSTQNLMLQHIAIVFFFALVWFLAAPTGLLCFLGIAAFGMLLLEYTNYIEHYGLERNGNERVQATHSWNCDKVLSRFLLFDLSRHSDHHMHAGKSYHTLDTSEKSPELPGGYAALILPALIPPLWRAVIHPVLFRYHSEKTD